MLDVTFTPAAPYLLARSIGSPDLSRSFRGSVLQLAYPAGEHDATAHVWQRHDGSLQARIDSAGSRPPHTTACTGCSASAWTRRRSCGWRPRIRCCDR